MCQRICVFGCLCLAATLAFAQDDIANTAAKIGSGSPSEVTLYRDSALVTRVIELKSGKGPREVVVDELPESLVTSSVFAEGNATLAVRPVRVVQSPVAESTREDVRQIIDELKKIQEQITAVGGAIELTTANLQTLQSMIQFSSDSARSDLNHGVLQANTLTELVEFSMLQRKSISDELQQLEKTKKQLVEHEQLLQRRLAEVTSGIPKTRYQAKLFVELLADEPTTLRLSYAVSGCSWSPQYTITGKLNSDKFRLRYGALVQQLSGEQWNGVKLTLSTASPSVSAAGPTLAPLRVTAVDRSGSDSGMDPFGDSPTAEPMQMGQTDAPSSFGSGSPQSPLKGKVDSIRRKQSMVENQAYGVDGTDIGSTPQNRDVALNSLAYELQELELQAAAKSARGLAADAGDEVASQTYALEQPVSLDTRREQQLVEIVDAELTGEMYHMVTPLLTSFAYREASMRNDLTIGLLGGTAAIYLDDRFVGNTKIPTTASGQLLTIGFGADDQVRTRRELVNKKESVQGGNRRLEFEFRLVVSNFKDSAVKLRALDRIPTTDQSQQISVTFGESKLPLSDDKLYQRVQRPLGIIRWDVTVPASQFGSDAFDIDYGYALEFDRNRSLAVPHAAEQAQRDLFDLSLPAAMGGGAGGVMP